MIRVGYSSYLHDQELTILGHSWNPNSFSYSVEFSAGLGFFHIDAIPNFSFLA